MHFFSHAPRPVADGAAVPPDESRALRCYFAQHNQQALLLAFFSLAAALFLWAALYVAVYWFTLVGVTIARSFSLETLNQINEPGLVGRDFPVWFAAGALILLALAWVCRRQVRLERLREARLYLFWVAAELLLALPNVTFSVWGNLRAVCRLRRNEAAEALRLLRRMNEQGGRLELTSLRLEIEDERTLGRVVFALQLVGLVGVRESARGWFLCLEGTEALTLLRQSTSGS